MTANGHLGSAADHAAAVTLEQRGRTWLRQPDGRTLLDAPPPQPILGVRGLVLGTSVRVWGFTTVVAAVLAALALASLMWGGAGLPLVLPVAAVGLGIAAWLDFRRRRVRTKDDAFMRERQRADSNGIEFTEDEKQTLYTGD